MIWLIIFILQFPLLYLVIKLYKWADEIEEFDAGDINFLIWCIIPFVGFAFSIVIIILTPIYFFLEKGGSQKIADWLNKRNKK